MVESCRELNGVETLMPEQAKQMVHRFMETGEWE